VDGHRVFEIVRQMIVVRAKMSYPRKDDVLELGLRRYTAVNQHAHKPSRGISALRSTPLLCQVGFVAPPHGKFKRGTFLC
jgi:hypothetical protein